MLIVREVFFLWVKHIIDHFEVFFSLTKDNFGVKKVEAPSKTPREIADYVFC
jgi:hypothetical protein